jgi:hypothetical protein
MLSHCQTLESRGVHAASVEMVSIHICSFSYMPGYEVWVHHGEEVPENELVAEDVVTDEDRMDEMLNVICPKIEKDFEDPPYSRGSKVC